jgi:hypothetical protein
MSSTECCICKNTYNKNKNKPIMLQCGDTLCISCINHYKEALCKEEFECQQCCNMTKSSGIENKNAYPKDNSSNTSNQNLSQAQGEFDVSIKLLDGNRITVKVTKEMTVDQLKSKIVEKTGMNKSRLFLNFRKPLNNSQTLEFYNITRTVVIAQSTYEAGGAKN